MRVFKFFILFFIALIIGCASQKMQSYVGEEVREIIVDYGPPKYAFDMGDGRRAFQWVIGGSGENPITIHTTGTSMDTGYSAWVNSRTTISEGAPRNTECYYTFFALWDEERNGWLISGFREPRFICQ